MSDAGFLCLLALGCTAFLELGTGCRADFLSLSVVMWNIRKTSQTLHLPVWEWFCGCHICCWDLYLETKIDLWRYGRTLCIHAAVSWKTWKPALLTVSILLFMVLVQPGNIYMCWLVVHSSHSDIRFSLEFEISLSIAIIKNTSCDLNNCCSQDLWWNMPAFLSVLMLWKEFCHCYILQYSSCI